MPGLYSSCVVYTVGLKFRTEVVSLVNFTYFPIIQTIWMKYQHKFIKKLQKQQQQQQQKKKQVTS